MHTTKPRRWTKGGVFTVLVFVGLAVIVDLFAVPDLEAQGKGLFTAIIEGTFSVVVCALLLVFVVVTIWGMFTKKRR